jgi:hypothetical protein
MPDYTPPFQPGAAVTRTASAAITGGQVVEVSGNGTVAATAGASAKVVGVAAHDAVSGARVTVHGLQGQVHEVTSTAGATAGNGLTSGASGTVVDGGAIGALAAAGTLIGVAENTGGAGAKIRFTGKG